MTGAGGAPGGVGAARGKLVLGIETSCDETAAAVVGGAGAWAGRRVLSNVIASQHELHAEYGGVVPEIASRAHAERLLAVVRRALGDAGVGVRDLDAIAVGHRPGLIGALLVGVAGAKALAWSLGIPVVGVDHVQAHLYAGLLDGPAEGGEEGGGGGGPGQLPVEFPALGLVVSGGHTTVYRLDSSTRLTRLGSTIDDAVGEAYDKVGAILKLPFPGGPHVDRLAASGNDRAFDFPVSRLSRDSLDFSFSGLKTAVRYAVEGVPGSDRPGPAPLTAGRSADIAASFQRAAVRALVMKLTAAAEANPDVRALLVGGGVSANSQLRGELGAFASGRGWALRLPRLAYCVDNAAMIAGLGCEQLGQRGWRGDALSLTASPAAAC